MATGQRQEAGQVENPGILMACALLAFIAGHQLEVNGRDLRIIPERQPGYGVFAKWIESRGRRPQE